MPRPTHPTSIAKSRRPTQTDRVAADAPVWVRPSATIALTALTVLACAFAALVSVTALAPALTATPALAATATSPTESVAVFEGQLRGHRVTAVTVHTKAHKLHVVLKGGHTASVVFPAASQQRLQREIEARGVTVKVAKVKPPSHKRRDIAIAVAVILVIALLVGAWLLVRRRRMREEEYGPAG